LAEHRYLIALGSNVPHPRHGRPDSVLRAAFAALDGQGLLLEAAAPIMTSAPVGPSRRQYANSAALVRTSLPPQALLRHLKALEAAFGRRVRGMRWRARVLDLDVILWSGGRFATPSLTIPHRHYRERAFVLLPAARISPDWRDPHTGLTLRQQTTRLTRPRPASRAHPPRTHRRGQGALSSVGRATDF
jgi:2-amino-4-hydroxy-6-hydroxymethyldihydropteridine diphosphokinase